jgi:hypothetical protein
MLFYCLQTRRLAVSSNTKSGATPSHGGSSSIPQEVKSKNKKNECGTVCGENAVKVSSKVSLLRCATTTMPNVLSAGSRNACQQRLLTAMPNAVSAGNTGS